MRATLIAILLPLAGCTYGQFEVTQGGQTVARGTFARVWTDAALSASPEGFSYSSSPNAAAMAQGQGAVLDALRAGLSLGAARALPALPAEPEPPRASPMAAPLPPRREPAPEPAPRATEPERPRLMPIAARAEEPAAPQPLPANASPLRRALYQLRATAP